VEVIVKDVDDALLIPADAVIHDKENTFVRMKDPQGGAIKNMPIVIGIENEGLVEVVSGISEGDIIYAPERAYVVPKKKNGSTPFLPNFRKGKDEPKK